jgi:hypothetical protein
MPGPVLWALFSVVICLVAALPTPPWTERRMVVEEGDHEWTLFETPDSDMTVAFVCGMHGRELLSTRLCREWMRTLRAQARCRPRLRFAFLPEANADGAHLARTSDACHRGNANGVDLNRNFPPTPFASKGPRGNSSQQLRVPDPENPGPRPMSERETRSIDRALRTLEPAVLFNVHWGTNALLAPYDGSWRSPPNARELMRFARWMAQEPLGGREGDDEEAVACSTGAHALYESVGTLTDHAHHNLGVPLVYTLEAAFSSAEGRRTSDCEAIFGLAGRCEADWKAWYERKWRALVPRLCELTDDDEAALRRMVASRLQKDRARQAP